MSGGKIIWQQLVLIVLWTSLHQTMGLFPPAFMPFYPEGPHNTEEPSDSIISAPKLEKLPETPQPAECYITVQVTKKLAGHCINMGGNNMKGCVSGSLLHPFHTDC